MSHLVCDCTQKASLAADESEMKNGFMIKVIKVHQKHDSGWFFIRRLACL